MRVDKLCHIDVTTSHFGVKNSGENQRDVYVEGHREGCM